MDTAQRLRAWSPLFWAVTVAVAIGQWFSVAWWHPNCQILDSGLNEYPAYGLPFPYYQGSPVLSLEWHFMPHVMALNFAILTAISLPLTRAAVRFVAARSHLVDQVQAAISVVLFFGFGALTLSWLHSAAHPMWSIARSPETYLQYRPMLTAYEIRGASSCYAPSLAEPPSRQASGTP